jgi:O-antigen/teichoic acid export membrane protein
MPPLVLYFVLTGWSEFLGVDLRARGRRVAEALVLLSLRGVTLVAVVLALSSGASLTALSWAHVAAAVPPLALSTALAGRGRPVDTAPGQGVSTVLRASLPLAVNGGLALVALRVELLLVFWLRGSFEAGLFGAAIKIVEALNGIPTAISAGAMPSLTREALASMDSVPALAARRRAVRARTAASAALLGVPAALGLALLAPGVVRLLGSDYAPAAPALRILSAAVVAHFMNSVLIHSLIAAGRAGWLPRMIGARVAFAVAVALVLVPRWGAVGAAAGYAASELLLLAAYARACVVTRFAVPLATPLALAAAASLPMALAVAALEAGTVARAVAGAAVYAGSLAVAWVLLRTHLVRALGVEETA